MSHAITRVRSAAENALFLVQKEFPEYHPLIGLARMAHQENVRSDPRLELEVHKAILPYVTPKLASLEVKDAPSDDRRVIVTLFEDAVIEDARTVPVEIPMVVEGNELVPLD